MYINENYNLGLLVLFHLLLVAILKIILFIYVIKPIVQKHMKKLYNDLPELNEDTLDKFGIYHNDTLSTSLISIINGIIKNNEHLSMLSTGVNEIYENHVSDNIKKYFEKKIEDDKLKQKEKEQLFNYRIFLILTAILATIVTWYIIHLKHKNIKADIPELVLGNIIPLIMIFAFEIYFINTIAVNYKVVGKIGFLHETLKQLYPIHS